MYLEKRKENVREYVKGLEHAVSSDTGFLLRSVSRTAQRGPFYHGLTYRFSGVYLMLTCVSL